MPMPSRHGWVVADPDSRSQIPDPSPATPLAGAPGDIPRPCRLTLCSSTLPPIAFHLVGPRRRRPAIPSWPGPVSSTELHPHTYGQASLLDRCWCSEYCTGLFGTNLMLQNHNLTQGLVPRVLHRRLHQAEGALAAGSGVDPLIHAAAANQAGPVAANQQMDVQKLRMMAACCVSSHCALAICRLFEQPSCWDGVPPS